MCGGGGAARGTLPPWVCMVLAFFSIKTAAVEHFFHFRMDAYM